MEKRGVSALIATVLLVGIAVVLATVLMFFFTNLSKDQTKQAEDDLTLSQYCLKKVKIDYSSFRFEHQQIRNPNDETIESNVNADIFVKLENKADSTIKELVFSVISDEDKTVITRFTVPADYLGPYERKEYEIDYTGQIYLKKEGNTASDEIKNLKIIVSKKIEEGNIQGSCPNDELDLNIIYGIKLT